MSDKRREFRQNSHRLVLANARIAGQLVWRAKSAVQRTPLLKAYDMSHPVFLESPPWPRMPEGRKGELPTYFGRGGPSLEANAGIPLFWRVLFAPEDIRFAYVIDDFDPQDQAIEIEEFLEDASEEEKNAKYPYLVTTKAQALERAARRRDALIALLDERYAPIYDAFVDYVASAYGDYVLVRTSGLPDVTDATGWLTAEMERVATLDGGKPVDAGFSEEADELRRARDESAVWQTTGVGDPHAEVHPWPSKALVEVFPACAPRPRREASTAATVPAKEKHHYRDTNRLDKMLEWVAVFAFAGAFLGTWVATHSVWLSILATVVVTAICVWIMLRIRRTD